MFADFTKQTGIEIASLYDIESSKSVGLSQKLIAEKDHPRADVWWGSEAFLTTRLADEGELIPYNSPSAADIEKQFKDPQGMWSGIGLRCRRAGRRPACPEFSDQEPARPDRSPAQREDLHLAPHRRRDRRSHPLSTSSGDRTKPGRSCTIARRRLSCWRKCRSGGPGRARHRPSRPDRQRRRHQRTNQRRQADRRRPRSGRRGELWPCRRRLRWSPALSTPTRPKN